MSRGLACPWVELDGGGIVLPLRHEVRMHENSNNFVGGRGAS